MKFLKMLIDLAQHTTGCSNSPGKVQEDLIAGHTAVKAETEFIKIRLNMGASTVIGPQQESFQIADGLV